MDTEKNSISPTISESFDEYYDAYYDEFADNILENSEESENENDIETNTCVYYVNDTDYSLVLESINQGVYGCSVLLVLLLLFGIGKVVFNTLKEIF